MDDTTKRFVQRLMKRIPAPMLRATLDKWDRLTREQKKSMDFTQSKWALTEKMLAFSEENELTAKHLTELEMIYDAHSVELIQFKEQFKSHLRELVRHVSIKIKKHTDEAVWIRIAWGDAFTRPNHLKPTYVVHYLHSPYVFVTSLTLKQKPLLSQALVLATRYQAIKDANLSGRKLTAIRDLLMRKYQQVFPTKYPSPLPENNQNPHIEKEQAEPAANRLQMACEAFGSGMLPQLQSAVYKLETKFRDHSNQTMSEREEPFRCVVKFESTNLLESLRHCASSGIASTPVTPLLSCIPQKGRNYFVITDNGPGPSARMRQPQN
ncbi:centromere protein N isoform X2 [Pseudoliparis swirei]|uniref:centromere protein N isoform X2 n=1 Tax=Pseudoliparis swirei TaxID=2059687 RepID=UPI0024BED754|nr:centromere protein N isoform X2 [Pseudoliparis swirei]